MMANAAAQAMAGWRHLLGALPGDSPRRRANLRPNIDPAELNTRRSAAHSGKRPISEFLSAARRLQRAEGRALLRKVDLVIEQDRPLGDDSFAGRDALEHHD